MRRFISGYCGSDGSTQGATQNSAVAATDFIAYSGAGCAADATTDRGIQSGPGIR